MTPADLKTATADLTAMVRVEEVRDLISGLPKFQTCSRQPELEAAKRAAFEILHDARRQLDEVVTRLIPRLAERIAQERAEDEETDDPDLGALSPVDLDAWFRAAPTPDIEAALAAKKIGEML